MSLYVFKITVFLGNGITKELGMQSGYIQSNQITASSSKPKALAMYSRLNHKHKVNVAEGENVENVNLCILTPIGNTGKAENASLPY